MAEQGEQFRNWGPAAKFESARDVTSNGYIAHEMLIINNNVPPTLEPRAISFRNIPEPHGSFVGRVEYIKSVIEYLSCPVVAEVQIQFPFLVIHALGGYGKTQTARKIASICSKERTFQHFIWIDSEDHENVKKCFVAVMIQVGLNASVKTDALNFDLLLHQFYNLLAFRNHDKFFIIFDNVEDFDNILTFLPLNRSASNLAVLMTSRRSFTRESYGHIRNQPLDLMIKEEAIQLVENILGTSKMDSEEDKKLLVEQSGRIALVLCVMTSTIKFQRRYKRDYKIKDYLGEMGDKPIKYSDKSKELNLDYDKCLQKIVRFAVDKLNDGAPIQRIAVNIFDRLVYLRSSNYFFHKIRETYFSDICEDAKNMDMQLPIEQVDDKQIFDMAVEKLSEFSLVQIVDAELIVHRWIQASRRLDLKASGDDEAVLKNLLIWNESDPIEATIWQHVVVDCPQLVNEFYAEKRTLMAFPIYDVDLLEKVIHILTQREDFQPFENYDENIVEIICCLLEYQGPNVITRVVNLFDYDMSKKARKFISAAISAANLATFEWLVDEKSFIPDKIHLIECVSNWNVRNLGWKMAILKESSIKYIEKRSAGCTCESRSDCILHVYNPIKSATEHIELLYWVDSDPLKIHLCKIIEENYGKDILQEMLSYTSKRIGLLHRDIEVFEIMRIIRSTLEKLEPNIESDEIYEMYSENNLLECFFFCGQAHFTKSHSDWRSKQRRVFKCTPYENDTRLMIAVKDGACEATTVLLENYSGDVNEVDYLGETALSYAIKLCYPSICNILLRHGARTTCWKTKSGTTEHALHMAVITFRDLNGSEPDEIIYAILTSKDCDVCAVDDLGNNILHLLVRYYYATRYTPNNNVLQFILSACPNLVVMRNNKGFTPLQLAISLHDQFSHNHWHRASLQSFISIIEPIAMDAN